MKRRITISDIRSMRDQLGVMLTDSARVDLASRSAMFDLPQESFARVMFYRLDSCIRTSNICSITEAFYSAFFRWNLNCSTRESFNNRLVVWLDVWVLRVSTLMPNWFLYKSILFQTILFSMSTQFDCQKHFYVNLFSLFKQF